jgi:hypothetical protein
LTSSRRKKKPAPEPIDARNIARAAGRRWDLVRSRLAPIIGEDGFRVLFSRSLHCARMEHAWLAREPAQSDTAFSALERSLESQPLRRAAAGNRALVAHFNDLLNALIGEELAVRLIGPVLPAADRTNQEID